MSRALAVPARLAVLAAGLAAAAPCPEPKPEHGVPDPATCAASRWVVDGVARTSAPPPGRCWAFVDIDGDGAWTPAVDEPLAWDALRDACDRTLPVPGDATRVVEARTPSGSATWRCTSQRSSRLRHTLRLTSAYGIVTPALVPNAERYFPDELDLELDLGGDFVNYSCAGWKGHDEGASLHVRAANVLLGGFAGGTAYVYGGGPEAIRFEATTGCIVGGDVTRNPRALPDFVCRGDNQLRLHDRNRCQYVLLHAPNGTIDLGRRWRLTAQNAFACLRARTLGRAVGFRHLRARCEVVIDEAHGIRRRHCRPEAETFCACAIGAAPGCDPAALPPSCGQ